MGAMTAAALRFDPEVAARAAATSCAESTMARDMCAQSKMQQLIRVNIAGAIQASLLYAATTVRCSYVAVFVRSPENKLAVRYYNLLRKAVDGAWSTTRQ